MIKAVIDFYYFCDALVNDRTKPWYPLAESFENQTGVKKVFLLFILFFCMGCYLIFGYGAQLLCNFIGFAYPAYQSMVAIETPQTRDDTKWLTYWTTYALFSLIEYPSDVLLFWCPFYWLLKCMFFIWLFAPIEYNGSVMIYRTIIRPLFLKHRNEVDNVINQVIGQATNVIKEVKRTVKTD